MNTSENVTANVFVGLDMSLIRETWLYVVVAFILCNLFTGIFGNVTTLKILLDYRRKSSTDTMIIGLCVCNLTAIAVNGFIETVEYLKVWAPFANKFACQLNIVVFVANYLASTTLFIFIAIERFFKICQRQTVSPFTNRGGTITGAIFPLCYIWALLNILWTDLDKHYFCTIVIRYPHIQFVSTFLTFIFLLIGTFFIIVCYGKVIRQMRRIEVVRATSPGIGNRQQNHDPRIQSSINAPSTSATAVTSSTSKQEHSCGNETVTCEIRKQKESVTNATLTVNMRKQEGSCFKAAMTSHSGTRQLEDPYVSAEVPKEKTPDKQNSLSVVYKTNIENNKSPGTEIVRIEQTGTQMTISNNEAKLMKIHTSAKILFLMSLMFILFTIVPIFSVTVLGLTGASDDPTWILIASKLYYINLSVNPIINYRMNSEFKARCKELFANVVAKLRIQF